MYVCIYIYTYVYIYIYECVSVFETYIYIYIHICVHICIYVYMQGQVPYICFRICVNVVHIKTCHRMRPVEAFFRQAFFFNMKSIWNK